MKATTKIIPASQGHLLRDTDLSTLRGIQPPNTTPATGGPSGATQHVAIDADLGLIMSDYAKGRPDDELMGHSTHKTEIEEELEALAELVPGLRTGKVGVEAVIQQQEPQQEGFILDLFANLIPPREHRVDSPTPGQDNDDDDGNEHPTDEDSPSKKDIIDEDSDPNIIMQRAGEQQQHISDPKYMNVGGSGESPDIEPFADEDKDDDDDSSPFRLVRRTGRNHNTRRVGDDGSDFSDDPATLNQLYKDTASTGSAHPLPTQTPFGPSAAVTQEPSISAGSTATQTADGHTLATTAQNSPHRPFATNTTTARMNVPMHLPHFKPATGCTNATDFIVRCFVARLRSGITVIKHARSRWSKSHLRTLYVLPDGRTLTWRPAVLESHHGYGSSNNNAQRRRRPPQLDLLTCSEVRHAWSADPSNPMFTGTPILRQKCEAAFAHKSFALIFEKRSLDITAVTADQCKVLLEGFSALCFRLQLAQLVMNKADGTATTTAVVDDSDASKMKKKGEEDDRTTASVTLTNNSTAAVAGGSGSVTTRKTRGTGFKKGIKNNENVEGMIG